MRKAVSCLFAASLVLSSYAINNNNKEYYLAEEHIKNLPEAPKGYKWVVNEDYTDEFNGRRLSASKWHAKSPYWTNGRPPATFKAENVSVKKGCLRITNTVLSPTEGLDGKPGDKYSLAGGAVASVKNQAHYGYYETRMKASLTTMSSTFWLSNRPVEKKIIKDGKEIRTWSSQELDIIETMGVIGTVNPDNPWNKKWNMQMNSNAHYWYQEQGGKRTSYTSNRSDVESYETDPSAEDFHTYGCWWVDANTVKFYYDGKYMYTIKPTTEFTDTPFDRPMFIHIVTETYDWEPKVPTEDDLKDKEKSTTYYDWVRAYKLVPIEE